MPVVSPLSNGNPFVGFDNPFTGGVSARGAALTLVQNNFLNPTFTFTRASAATAFDGSTLREFGNNVPRLTSAGLLLEGQRTNLNTNPRAEGATPGTPGVAPTGWGPPSGVAREVIGVQTIGGLTGLVIRFAGVPTGTGSQFFNLGPGDSVAVATSVANSVYVALVAGSVGNISNIDLRNGAEAGATPISPTLTGTPQYYRNVRITTGTSALTVLRWNYLDTVTPVDFTLFIALPQREHAPFASSPILPPIGTPGVTTRLADNAAAPLSALGIGPNGAFTVVGRFIIPQNAVGVGQVLFQADAGDAANRFFLVNDPGGANVTLSRLAANLGQSQLVGSMVAGTPFRVGVSYNPATGEVSASLNGTAVSRVTGAPPAGLSVMRLGNTSTGSAPLNGTVSSLRLIPRVVSDAELQSLSLVA